MKQNRTEIVPVRMSAGERRVLLERARVCGRGVSTYVRELALGKTVRARPRYREMKAIHQIARIGNNLWQIRCIAEATGNTNLAQRIQDVLDELEQAVRRLA